MNYPDNIRQFDSDPRSPFYDDADERLEEAVQERTKEIAAEMLTQDGYKERGAVWGVGDVTEHIYSDIDESSRFDLILAAVLEGENTVANLKGFMLKHAEAVANDIAWREVE